MKAARICTTLYTLWAIILMDASAAAEAPTNFAAADNAVCKALLKALWKSRSYPHFVCPITRWAER